MAIHHIRHVVHTVARAVDPPAPHIPTPDLFWGHSPEFWAAIGTLTLAAATVALILIGWGQISAIKKQNRRWQTLAACERYTFDPILDGCLRTLRKAHTEGKFDKDAPEAKTYRLEATTVLNYLDGMAIGISQGLYMEDLARDHLEEVVIGHVNEYLIDGMPKKLAIDTKDFRYLLALSERWATISRPRFREGEFHWFRRRP